MSRFSRAWAAFPMRAAALLMLLLSALLPVHAQAHAVLLKSSPANNQVVEEAPAKVDLHFNEPVRIVRASARLADETSVELQSSGAGPDISLALPPLGRGTAIVSYRVVSEDGHPVGGAIVFHVGEASGVGAERAESSSIALDAAIWLIHAASILLLAHVVGGRLFSALFNPADADARRPMVSISAGSLLLALGLYLQGLDEVGAGLAFAGMAPLLSVIQGNSATAVGLLFTALLLAVLPPATTRSFTVGMAVLAIAVASAAFTFTGHCAIASPAWLAKTCIFFHSGVLLFWIGSLAPLWRLSRQPSSQKPLESFSIAIPAPFIAMLLAGVALAFLELPNLHTMLESMYGRVLVFKMGLVGALCVVAAYNRFWLTGPATRGDAAALARLRKSIAAEMVLAVAIVCTASLWRFAGPDQFQYALPAPISLHIHTAAAMAQLEVEPKSNNAATVHVAPLTSDFEPMHPKAVSLRLWNPAAGIEAMKYELSDAGNEGWKAENIPFRSPAGWKVDVQILIDDFTTAHLEADLDENEAGSPGEGPDINAR